MKDRDGNGAGIFVTYNETSEVYPVLKGEETRCFGAQLLLSCVGRRTAEIATRVKTLGGRAEPDGMPGTTPLTICVDSISQLGLQTVEGYDPAQATISALKKYGDDQEASPVYFVFASLIAAYEALVDKTHGSQRPIKKVPLMSLTDEAARSLLDDKRQDLLRRSPAYSMVFGALSGHPRAVVEAFIPFSEKAEADDNDACITSMIDTIFERCKFAHHLGYDVRAMTQGLPHGLGSLKQFTLGSETKHNRTSRSCTDGCRTSTRCCLWR